MEGRPRGLPAGGRAESLRHAPAVPPVVLLLRPSRYATKKTKIKEVWGFEFLLVALRYFEDKVGHCRQFVAHRRAHCRCRPGPEGENVPWTICWPPLYATKFGDVPKGFGTLGDICCTSRLNDRESARLRKEVCKADKGSSSPPQPFMLTSILNQSSQSRPVLSSIWKLGRYISSSSPALLIASLI